MRQKRIKIREKISLAHGNGGKLMHELIERLRLKFSNKILDELGDAAELPIKKSHLSFSTDSYVVKPLFFSGGDIGKLAVCGTVNDVAMKGAKPLFISLSFILEEGLEFSILEEIADSIKRASDKAKVLVVTGDIKVVERNSVDKVFINTAGIGIIESKNAPCGCKVRKGDAIVINGGIAEHGMAILSARENFGFSSKIRSDCTNLNFIVERCLSASKNISLMRDVTRGGLATVLGEISLSSKVVIELEEEKIPIKPEVKKMCDILGFDPLYVANEGKFICFVKAKDALKVKRAIGAGAKIIGRVTRDKKEKVYLKTKIGSTRLLPLLESDQLPRIC